MSPQLLLAELPMTCVGRETILRARDEISDVIQGKDDRLIVIVGPCSVHDPKAAIDYAQRLKAEKDKHAKDLVIVMRVYFG